MDLTHKRMKCVLVKTPSVSCLIITVSRSCNLPDYSHVLSEQDLLTVERKNKIVSCEHDDSARCEAVSVEAAPRTYFVACVAIRCMLCSDVIG